MHKNRLRLPAIHVILYVDWIRKGTATAEGNLSGTKTGHMTILLFVVCLFYVQNLTILIGGRETWNVRQLYMILM